jgi:hypothetical protein
MYAIRIGQAHLSHHSTLQDTRSISKFNSNLFFLRYYVSTLNPHSYIVVPSGLASCTKSVDEANLKLGQSPLPSSQSPASMGPKLLYVTITSGGSQLLTVVRCCRCDHRSGLLSDYSTPSTCFRNGCLHAYCANCEWIVEGEFRKVSPDEIRDDTKPD